MVSKEFWNKEYKDPKHLTMSTEASGDLLDFVKWTNRNAEWPAFPKHGMIIDIGCGNGRNLIPLCYEFNMNGLGTEISEVAISQAKNLAIEQRKEYEEEGAKISPGLKIEFIKQSAEETADGALSEKIADQSVDVVLDMMVSHQLVKKDREALAKEFARIIKPYGWLFFKTFILDGDSNAYRMIEEHKITREIINKNPQFADEDGKPEKNSYIHPHTKGFEHVYNEDEIIELFSPFFKIYKVKKSYKHVLDGKPHKRRTVSVYMERLRD